MVDHGGQKGAQRVVEPVDIQQEALVGSQVQSHAGEDLRDFLQSAHAAGQCHERLAQLDHLRLALAHGVGHDQFG